MALFKTPSGEVRAHGGRSLSFSTSNGRRATFDVALSLSQVSQLQSALADLAAKARPSRLSRGGHMIGALFTRRTADCHSRRQERTGAGGEGGKGIL